MKKLLHLIILVPLFCFIARAQQGGLPKRNPKFDLKNTTSHLKYNLTNRVESVTTCEVDSEYWWAGDTVNMTNWVFDDKEFFTYDTNGNLIDDKFNHFNGNTWVTTRENMFTYNTNNNVTTDITYYNGVASDKIIYTYNTNNKKTSALELWDYGSGWTNYYLDTFIYNGAGNLIDRIEKQWSGTAWVNYLQTNYFYNANNYLIKDYYRTWQSTYWYNSSIDSLFYDANNNLVTDVGRSWVSGIWANSALTTDTYDANNNLTTYNIKTWNGTAWSNWNWYTYTYCSNNCVSAWDTKTWDSTSNGWKKYDSLITFCSYRTGIEKSALPTNKIIVYPNPANTFITIETGIENKEIKIVDVLSDEIINEKVNGRNNLQIDIGNLRQGVYFIKTAQGTQKFIKQ